MEISVETDNWLKENGYEYHCFISYPKIHEKMKRFAEGVKAAIEIELAASVYEPKVFLDDQDIEEGAEWDGVLRGALCRSVSMVAICLSAYYHPKRPWCGLEWAAMDNLGSARLKGFLLRPIIPLIVKLEKPIPEAVLDTQYVKMTTASLTWEDHCSTEDFRKNIRKVTNYISLVAEAIANNQAEAGNCGGLARPERSAFADWKPERPPFPNHLRK